MTPTDPTPLGDAGSADPCADVKPRHLIWGMSCPFNKQGVADAATERADNWHVVIIPAETWTALCKEHPTLAATEFEVGIYGD